MAIALISGSCTTVDPGPNFQLPTIQFNANYFFCVVEPQIIMGGLTKTPCGDNGSHGCHYSDKVPEMALEQLAQPVECAGGVPVGQGVSDTASGTPAANNYASVSDQMNAIYTTAPIYLWPSQTISDHPVMVFSTSDTAVVDIIKTWASL
jgi:hypothetical protein